MSNAAPTPNSAGALHPADVARHPPFLLGRAEPDPHDLRAGVVDLADDVGVFLRGQRPERRRVGSDDLQTREALRQVAPELIEHLVGRRRRRKIPSRVRRRVRRPRASGRDRRRAACSWRPPAAGPHHRHAVGGRQARFVVDAQQLGVALRLHHAVHAGDADVVLLRLSIHRVISLDARRDSIALDPRRRARRRGAANACAGQAASATLAPASRSSGRSRRGPSSSVVAGSQPSTSRSRVLSELRPRTPCGPRRARSTSVLPGDAHDDPGEFVDRHHRSVPRFSGSA